ncbi:lipoyl(octanoyl) transferase LipB [Chitinimonas lacunae]|uniref:Octanoyltransferase n=1 Tax=Chitinimonas lacunae TaxID=1963018 RepID=A0ABV8MNP0_9NEIS
MLASPELAAHWLGTIDYESSWRTMQRFTDCRTERTGDELWLLEHPPVFTQGQAGKPEHLLRRDGIPLVRSDRGGQITYHGPGQLVVYPLLDLSRRRLGVRDLVRRLEQSLIDLLADFAIKAHGRVDAPGVYVGEAKIASLGLRIRHGRSYHGLALNVAMDLGPFSQINPCGYQGMAMTQLADFGIEATPYSLAPKLADKINALLAVDGSASLADYALSAQPQPENHLP